MKITEFAANMSSILSAILLILFAGVRYLNMFFAEQSIIKRIFQFKDFYKNMKNEIVLNKMKDRFFFPLTNNNNVKKSNRSRNEEIASDNNMKDKTNLKTMIVRTDSIFSMKTKTNSKTTLQVNDVNSLHLLAQNRVHVNINLFEYTSLVSTFIFIP